MKETINRAKNEFITNKIQSCTGNRKGVWRILKQLVLNDKKMEDITELYVNNTVLNSQLQIAEHLNSYFISNIETIHSSIPFQPYTDEIQKVTH